MMFNTLSPSRYVSCKIQAMCAVGWCIFISNKNVRDLCAPQIYWQVSTGCYKPRTFPHSGSIFLFGVQSSFAVVID